MAPPARARRGETSKPTTNTNTITNAFKPKSSATSSSSSPPSSTTTTTTKGRGRPKGKVEEQEQEEEEEEEEEKKKPTKPSTKSSSSSSSFPSSSSQPKFDFPIESLRTTKNTDELSTKLLKVSEFLSSYVPSKKREEGEAPPPLIQSLSNILVERSLLRHNSPSIRLIVSCCMVDILRICAPSSPYKENELKAVLNGICEEGLEKLKEGNSTNLSKYYYILETFSLMSGSAIACELEDKSVINRIFEVCYRLAAMGVGQRIEFHLGELIQVALEEMGTEGISPAIMDMILSQFTENKMREYGINQPSPFAINIIHRNIRILQKPLERWIKRYVIAGEGEKMERGKGKRKGHKGKKRRGGEFSEEEEEEERLEYDEEERGTSIIDHASHLQIFFHLNNYCGEIMSGLYMEQVELISSADGNKRREYVELYGKMFSTNPQSIKSLTGEYDNERLFSSFLERFKDINVEIRVLMAEYLKGLLLNHISYLDQYLWPYIPSLLVDREERVRYTAVRAVWEAALDNVLVVNSTIITEISKRVLDKKINVRMLALDGLAKLFDKYCGPSWRHSQPLAPEAKKFSLIPQKIFQSAGIDSQTALTAEILLDEYILGAKEGIEERTRCLMGCIAILEKDIGARNVFIDKIIKGKSRINMLVQLCIDKQREIKEGKKTGDTSLGTWENQQELLLRRLAGILTLEPNVSLRSPQFLQDIKDIYHILYSIFQLKDKNILKYLSILINPLSKLNEIRAAKTEFQHLVRVQLKGTKGESNGGKGGKELSPAQRPEVVVSRLTNLCSMALIPFDSIQILFNETLAHLKDNNPVILHAALDLLVEMSIYFPSILTHSFSSLYELLTKTKGDTLTMSLRILSSIEDNTHLPHSTGRSVLKRLREICGKGKGTPQQVKYAIIAIKRLYGKKKGKGEVDGVEGGEGEEDKGDKELREMMEECVEGLDVEDIAHLPSQIAAIGTIASLSPSLFLSKQAEITETFNRILLLNQHSLVPSKTEVIMAYSSYLIALHSSNINGILKIASGFITILLKLLRAQGKLTRDTGKEGEEEKISEEDENEIYLTTAKCLIDCCGCDLYHRILFQAPSSSSSAAHAGEERKSSILHSPSAKSHPSPSVPHPFHFANLALVANHPSPLIKQGFIDYVQERLIQRKLPFSYSIILAFAFNEENKEYRDKIKRSLINLISRQRREALSSPASHRVTKEGKVKANSALPEFVLADLIYLLSYHPLCEDKAMGEGDNGDVSHRNNIFYFFSSFIDYYIDCLCADKQEGKNYSLCLAILTTIRQCEDVRDHNNIRIYKLTELCIASLHYKYQGKEWASAANHGLISLPSSMYQPRDHAPRGKYLPKDFEYNPKHKVIGGGDIEYVEKERENTTGSRGKRKSMAAEGDEEGESESEGGGKRRRSTKGRKSKGRESLLPSPAPTRRLPSRMSRGNVSYTEKEESDYFEEEGEGEREMEEEEEEEEVNGKREYSPEEEVEEGKVVEEEEEEEVVPPPRSRGRPSKASAAAASPLKPKGQTSMSRFVKRTKV